uniref:VWFA domain-containing protein n=1 Tax=Rhabditophanes sp. KR3021 TaxID=114890 RepID=A0AC35U6T6_9BILA
MQIHFSVLTMSLELGNKLKEFLNGVSQPDKIVSNYRQHAAAQMYDPRKELKNIKKKVEAHMGHRAKLAWQAKTSLQARALQNLDPVKVNNPNSTEFIRYMNAKTGSDSTVVYGDGPERVAIFVNSTNRFKYTTNVNLYRLSTSFEASAVHFPTPVYNRQADLLNQVQWSDIDQVYQKNKERMKDLFFQSFCSESGFMRFFPAAPWAFDNDATQLDLFDCRTTEWFLASATMPKNVIIMLDLSGSMLGQRFEIAKQTVEAILETLSDNDYFNIIPFSKTANLLGTCENENMLLQATLRNKKILRSKLGTVTSEGKADYEIALAKAFSTILNHTIRLSWYTKEQYYHNRSLYHDGVVNNCSKVKILEDHVVCGTEAAFKVISDINDTDHKSEIGCNNAVMLITDGAPGYYKETFELYKIEKRVRFFSFLIGEEAVDFIQVQWMACLHRGFMVHIQNMADVHEKVQHYVKVMSRSVGYFASLVKEKDATWSGIQLERVSKKFVTTVSYPVVLNQTVMGVSSLSIPLIELEQFSVPSLIGARSHFFILDNNGYVVVHPQLTPIDPSTSKLKSGYNNMDLMEVEVISPEKHDMDTAHIFTCDNIETPKWDILYSVENLKRVYPQMNTYYTECVTNTEFIIGFAIGESDEKRVEKKLKMDYSQVREEWFEHMNFKLNPDIRYCLLNDSDSNFTPEEAFVNYVKEMQRLGSLPELCKSRRELVDSLLLDAQATADTKEIWQFKSADYREERINLVFFATPSGMVRYFEEKVEAFKYLSDIDNATDRDNYPHKHFIKEYHLKSNNEDWYKRAVRMKNRMVIDINPKYQIPYDGPKQTAYGMIENKTILAHAYQAIYLDDAVVGVVGIEFDYDYLVGSMDGVGCGPGVKNNWCFLIDEHGYIVYSSRANTTFDAYLNENSNDPRNDKNVLGKWFGSLNRVTEFTMKKLTEPRFNYYSINKFVDYQAVCQKEPVVVAHSSNGPRSPLKNLFEIARWLKNGILKMVKSFKLSYFLTFFKLQTINAYTPSFQKSGNNSYACEKESPFFIANFDKKHPKYPALNDDNNYDRPCTHSHPPCAIKIYASWVTGTNLLLVSIVNTQDSVCYDSTHCHLLGEKEMQFSFKVKTDPGELGTTTTPAPLTTTDGEETGLSKNKFKDIASSLLIQKTTPLPNLALETPIDKKFFKCKKSPSKRRKLAMDTCSYDDIQKFNFVIYLSFFLIDISYINGSIQCFCTNQHCEERITCNGEYCLVGLSLKAGKASLEQMCVDHTVDMPESCSQNWNGFTEVCSCDKEYCNTFVFLRASIDTRQQEEIENLEMLGAGNSKTYDSSRDRVIKLY